MVCSDSVHRAHLNLKNILKHRDAISIEFRRIILHMVDKAATHLQTVRPPAAIRRKGLKQGILFKALHKDS